MRKVKDKDVENALKFTRFIYCALASRYQHDLAYFFRRLIS